MLTAQLDQDSLEDGDHHGGGGCVGDPHGEDGSGEHEAKQNPPGGTPNTQQYSESNTSEIKMNERTVSDTVIYTISECITCGGWNAQ